MTDTPAKAEMLKYRLPDGRTKLKAHDVRHLCTCTKCGGLADDRATVSPTTYPNIEWRGHPECFYKAFGAVGVERLDREQQNKFALGDIPASLMKKLVGG
jgi:hypothetical protein